LGRLERKLEKAIRDTEEAVAREQTKLKKLRQDWCRVKLRLRRLEYKESSKKPLFSE
jgi:hypothetical protein